VHYRLANTIAISDIVLAVDGNQKIIRPRSAILTISHTIMGSYYADLLRPLFI